MQKLNFHNEVHAYANNSNGEAQGQMPSRFKRSKPSEAKTMLCQSFAHPPPSPYESKAT